MFMGSSRLNIQTGHYAHINTVMESGMRLKHRLCYTYIYIFRYIYLDVCERGLVCIFLGDGMTKPMTMMVYYG